MISPGEHRPLAPTDSEPLSVYYQPLVALKSNSIISLEAFPCVLDSSRGNLPEFLDLECGLEGHGSALSVFQETLQRAFQDLKTWEAGQAYYEMISLKLSGSIFNGKLLPVIEAALNEFNISGNRLELLIPVELVVGGKNRAHQLLQLLKQLNLVLTFVSKGEQNFAESLSALSTLPVQGLRTQSFRQEPHRKFDEMEILFTINRGHILDIPVTVDAVSSVEQLQFLHEHGCDIIQGDIICRPQSSEFIQELLAMVSLDTFAFV